MPPKANTLKRKADSQNPTSDELDGQSAESEVETRVVKQEELALKAACEDASEACPAAKHSSGGSQSASIEGVVIRSSKISVQGPKGPIPKVQLTIATTKVSTSGCKDIIAPGIDGFAFGLPTRRLEATPDEIAKNPKAKGPVVLDVSARHTRANYLGVISSSFYMQKKDEDANSIGLQNCTPGMKVRVEGIVCEFSKNGTSLYTNAKAEPVAIGGSPVPPSDAAKRIIEVARSSNAQQAATLVLSMCMGGFFGLEYSEEHKLQQVEACRGMWEQVVGGCASKLDTIALSLDKSDSSKSTAEAVSANAERIRSMSAEEASKGSNLFDFDLQKDVVTPYIAPIVQYGVSHECDLPEMCMGLFDTEKRDRIPKSFVEGRVVGINISGNLIQVDFRLFFVFDKVAAIMASKEGKNAILRSKLAAASVKFTKKTIGQELIGSVLDHKINMVVKEIFFNCNMAIFASIYPRGVEDVQVDGFFANTSGIDVVDGIIKCGVKVSEKWLDEKMLNGRGGFFPPEPDDSVLRVEPSASCGPPPSLIKNGYQALTEAAFGFDDMKTPMDKTREIFVLYDGCRGNVAKMPKIATSTADGESHLCDIVAAVKDDNDIKAFLRENCVVYAVAV